MKLEIVEGLGHGRVKGKGRNASSISILSVKYFVLVVAAFVVAAPRLSVAFSPLYLKPAIKRSFFLQCSRNDECGETTRRMAIAQAAVTTIAGLWGVQPARGAVGSLPEYSDTNAILQGITVNVADQSQLDATIFFLKEAFGFEVLRQIKAGGNSDTWMGFGPEQLSIPSDFVLPVSSFGKYGGHASIHIRYDAQATDVYYKKGDEAPGDNLAYLQVGVPQYRISKMVETGGNVLDAFGIVNVVTPCGLPMRGIVGISPDPMMFVAVNCEDVQQSRAFYEQLGFAEQEYPYARPSKGTGQFEPPQPQKSVYLAPSPNSMGVLLLPSQKKRKKLKSNPVLRSLNVVYTPSAGADVASDVQLVTDPSGISLAFQSVTQFEDEQRKSTVF